MGKWESSSRDVQNTVNHNFNNAGKRDQDCNRRQGKCLLNTMEGEM